MLHYYWEEWLLMCSFVINIQAVCFNTIVGDF